LIGFAIGVFVSLTTRALWVIERNLDRELSLRALAAACDVSPCHLSHAFAERIGRPITHYVRGRRLSCAAEMLAGGAPDILDLALHSGYNSHEAFSRAFKELLGVTPESVRRRRTVAGLPLVAAMDLGTIAEHPLPPAEIRTTAATNFLCLFERVALDAMQSIPALWRRFMPLHAEVADKVHSIPVGVLRPIGEDGCFDYGCGVEVSASSSRKGLTMVSVPAQRYALFPHTAHVSTIRGTYDTIWNRALVESGWTMADQPSLERHHPTFDPLTGEGGITIWMPVVAGTDGHRRASKT
jgi:AraC family transcriptional regulator